jgi:hypothetical protein
MKPNFDTVLKHHITGDALKIEDKVDGKSVDVDLTLRRVSIEALLAFDPQKQESGEQKAKCYALAMRLLKGGEQEVSAEEIVLIKTKTGELYSPIVVGQTYDLLEDRKVGEA